MKTIYQIKEEFPQYKNIPDVKLANAIYQKYYSDKDENEFYKLVFPNIAKSKVAETERKNPLYEDSQGISFPDDEYNYQSAFENISFKPEVKDIAEKYGIGVETGASANARFAASLGYDEGNKALAIKKVLSNLYNEDIDVRVGNQTGELEFFNPKTKRYELVNKPGVDIGDFSGMGGEAMVIIPDIAATIAATIYSGGNLPVGVTAGMVTAGIAEYSRYKLGQKLYGINEDISNEQLLDRALIAAGLSGGSAVLGIGGANH
jgi:hypothetical protein